MERAWPSTSQKCLRKLVKKYQVGLVAIIKPFQNEERIDRFVQSFTFTNWCTNENQCGKIWVMWDRSQTVDIINMSDQMITGWTFQNGLKVFITFLYAKCGFYDIRKLWVDLDGLLKCWIKPLTSSGGL